MEGMFEMIEDSGIHQCMIDLCGTGGGAHKFQSMFRERLGIEIKTCDELECLVQGLNFLLKHDDRQAYTFEDVDMNTLKGTQVWRNMGEEIFPYLLVNIGSGVSILKVEGPGTHQVSRVSGTSIGGGTYWGLCRLLVPGCTSYEEVLDLAAQGDNNKVRSPVNTTVQHQQPNSQHNVFAVPKV
jgi:pantothenate kinase